MEWISEGLALMSMGVLVALVTYVDRASSVSLVVYLVVVGTLNVFSVVSLFTGFKNKLLPFKLRPFIFTGSSILVLIGAMMH
jgi:hypothetical protein